MDLNYLYHRIGVERMRADRAASKNSRIVHRQLAENYRAIIDDQRTARFAASETEG